MRSSCFSGRRLLCGLLTLAFIGLCSSTLQAGSLTSAPAAKPSTAPSAAAADVRTTTESVTGDVSGIGSSFIAVSYERKAGRELEMLLPMDRNVKLEHAKALGEIKPGAVVRVTYEKAVQGSGKTEQTHLKATMVSLLKPAMDALSSGESRP